MNQKIVDLENISLIDFFGANNIHINMICEAFPQTKIIVRGSQIKLLGTYEEIEKINKILNALIIYYQKNKSIDLETVKTYISQPNKILSIPFNSDTLIIYNIYGKPISAKTKNHIQLIEAVSNNAICFAVGPAGTGKTFVAVALAVKALKNKQVKKIIITRPIIETGEHLGFLPGDVSEKVNPYLQPIYDALCEMIPSERLKYYLEQKIIDIAPLAYMRGRTLKQAFIILDEAQNTTQGQMKMFLTRIGQHSKTVVTGDISQIDLPQQKQSGLMEAIRILKSIKGIKTVLFDNTDVVRHPIIKEIIQAYNHKDSPSS